MKSKRELRTEAAIKKMKTKKIIGWILIVVFIASIAAIPFLMN